MMVNEDSYDAFNSLFAFMAKSYDEDVNLLNIKQNLNNYSLKRIKGLASSSIDSLVEITNKKDL